MNGRHLPTLSTSAVKTSLKSGTRNEFRWRVVGSRGMWSNFQMPRFSCKAGHAGRVSPPGDLFVCGADCPHGSGVPWLQPLGGDDRPRWRFSVPREFVVLLEIHGSNFHRLAIRAGRVHSISQRVRISEISTGERLRSSPRPSPPAIDPTAARPDPTTPPQADHSFPAKHGTGPRDKFV